MAKNYQSSDVTTRAWHLLRLALLWGRKGGVLRQLRLLPKYVKSLGHHANHPTTSRIYYLERELSFDETPIMGFKNHRHSSKKFHIPCMSAPRVDFEYDFDDDNDDEDYCDSTKEQCGGEIVKYEEQAGIDERAEEFISKFYQQMKLQRQISYLQYYDDTPRKSVEC